MPELEIESLDRPSNFGGHYFYWIYALLRCTFRKLSDADKDLDIDCVDHRLKDCARRFAEKQLASVPPPFAEGPRAVKKASEIKQPYLDLVRCVRNALKTCIPQWDQTRLILTVGHLINAILIFHGWEYTRSRLGFKLGVLLRSLFREEIPRNEDIEEVLNWAYSKRWPYEVTETGRLPWKRILLCLKLMLKKDYPGNAAKVKEILFYFEQYPSSTRPMKKFP